MQFVAGKTQEGNDAIYPFDLKKLHWIGTPVIGKRISIMK